MKLTNRIRIKSLDNRTSRIFVRLVEMVDALYLAMVITFAMLWIAPCYWGLGKAGLIRFLATSKNLEATIRTLSSIELFLLSPNHGHTNSVCIGVNSWIQGLGSDGTRLIRPSFASLRVRTTPQCGQAYSQIKLDWFSIFGGKWDCIVGNITNWCRPLLRHYFNFQS